MIIRIKNLKIRTIIGVYEFEKNAARDLLLNVEMETAYKSGSDNIDDTLDYDVIAKMLVAETEASRFDLIEKLAEHLLEKIMAHKAITRARLEVDKPGAIDAAESVSVVVEGKK